ncbi:MAG: response regulator [Candidatus Omnitrophica bacterium]|nr:response regulator [Candidatus Omnitrophota bacterium]
MLDILVVDDEQEIARALAGFFSIKGYKVRIANDGEAAMELVREHRPHLVFLDIRMPKKDGLSVLREIREFDQTIKVIMVTAFGTKEIVSESMRLGAVDFVRKPFTKAYLEHDVIAKVSVQLFEDLRSEVDQKQGLIEQLGSLNERASRNFYQTILSLATALESRDKYTHGHSERVEVYSKLIAKQLQSSKMADINDQFLENLHIESRLHDIGKIAIPDIVLNKRGKLTAAEHDEIKRHPEESVRILAPLENIKDNIEVIYSHHERYDGTGYPKRKVGNKIPLRARIIAVADAFDAMTSDRPYRDALPDEAAFLELERFKEIQFDPMVVDAFSSAYWKNKKKITRQENCREEVLLKI